MEAQQNIKNNHIAIDLGATSGRIIIGSAVDFTEIHRFPTPMKKNPDGIYWDFSELFAGIIAGLQKLSPLAGTIASLSCDSWAQDFGMLDADGNLISDPISYRDSGSEIFSSSRLAYIERRFPERFARAKQILHIADLVHYYLCGSARSNYSLAAISRLPLDHRMLSPLADCEVIGRINHPELPALAGIPVISGAGHDTAAAFSSGKINSDEAFVSLGTWLMIATPAENDSNIPQEELLPLPGKSAARTVGGMGMWPFQQCVKQWKAKGIFTNYAELDNAAAASYIDGMILPDTPELFSPANMEEAVFKLRGARLAPEETTALLLRGTAHSIAEKLNSFGKNFSRVVLAGGGIGGKFMRDLIAGTVNYPLVFGNTEASAAGNIVIQQRVCAHLSKL